MRLRGALVVSLGFALFCLAGCGTNPALIAITVSPPTGTALLTAQGQTVQFTAIGTYLKTNKTQFQQDITKQVNWQSSTTAVATIDANGLATAVSDGVSTITASLDGVIGTSQMGVSSGNTLPVLTISKSGTGAGTVSSSPAGLNCGSACSAFFPSPTTVTLTATPSGSSVFGGFSANCIVQTATTCTITVTNGTTTVFATFN